jgi:hypothetical protein
MSSLAGRGPKAKEKDKPTDGDQKRNAKSKHKPHTPKGGQA